MDFKEYIDKGISYNEYEEHMQHIVDDGRSSGLNIYYPMNLVRMKRLDRKTILSANEINRLENIDKTILLLIITEGWCGDAAQILPVVQKMADASPQLDVKIVYRDSNPNLINEFLTNEGQSIPIILGLDENHQLLFRWGPRPAYANDILKNYKNGEINKDQFIDSIQKSYNKDKGQSIYLELIEKLENA